MDCESAAVTGRSVLHRECYPRPDYTPEYSLAYARLYVPVYIISPYTQWRSKSIWRLGYMWCATASAYLQCCAQ